MLATSDYGDGAYCVTGHKVLCSNNSQMCQATSTKAECYGVVMVCENGFNDTTSGAWRGCNSYACGACIGFGDSGISILSSGSASGSAGWGPIPCAQGFVWREAYQGELCLRHTGIPHTRVGGQRRGRRAPSARRRVVSFRLRLAGGE